MYSADGYAVKELLKISTLLYSSVKTKISDDQPDSSSEDLNISSKVNELKATRALASEITTIGASIFDLLGSEIELREARTNSLAKNMSTDEAEKSLRQTIQIMGERMNSLLQKVENLTADEGSLEAKIEKKKADLERFKNRLRSLKEVRPAFMDEYERLEGDLQRQYAMYLERFRNLEYLENELEQLHRTEQDAYEESQKHLKKLQSKSDKDGRTLVNNLSASLDDEDDFGDTNQFSSAEGTLQS